MQRRKMTELEQRMSDDFDWAEHAPEVQENPEHYGKLVVMHKRRIQSWSGGNGSSLLSHLSPVPATFAFAGPRPATVSWPGKNLCCRA